MRTHIFFAILAILVAANSSASVHSTVSSFGPAPQKKATFTLASPELSDPIEEKSFEKKIIAWLEKRGLVYTPGPAADYKISYHYACDNGRIVKYSEPIIGQTGVRASDTYGRSDGSGNFTAHTQMVPRYGEIGETQKEDTVFTRELVFSFANKNGEIAHKIKVTSEGPAGSVAPVMPQMIHAAFRDYPMEDGKTKRMEIDDD